MFSLSKANEIRREDVCMDSQGAEGQPIRMMNCHEQKGNQEWIHDRVCALALPNTFTMHHCHGACTTTDAAVDGEIKFFAASFLYSFIYFELRISFRWLE